jgi:type IV secretory pathway TraG/TraD family ATPase VirD4
MLSLERVINVLTCIAVCSVLGSPALAWTLRRFERRWTWALLGLPTTFLVVPIFGGLAGASVFVACLLASVLGALWHGAALAAGGDIAERAREEVGIFSALARFARNRLIARRGWIDRGRLVVGCDRRGGPVYIPVGERSGSHTLLLGATGSGKTVTETWIAYQLVAHGHGAIVIDPKGDRLLRTELEHVARCARRPFLEWTPQGPCSYNPYATGSASEIADKALAGEVFTEPHYLRLAQRYLAHAVRAMRAAQIAVTPSSLMAHMDPATLEVTSRSLEEEQAASVQSYLDSLGERQRRDLAGTRDRLSILAESDLSPWLEPAATGKTIDLRASVAAHAVVYFQLDSDRRPLLSQMLAAAILSDLISLIAHLQTDPIPTVVLIDEFSAIAAEHVSRLFARARSAGISLLLATQELADMEGVGDGTLRNQVLGNVQCIVAGRQNVPDSAELIAGIAGTKATWITTQQTDDTLASGRGSRRRGHEYVIHPSAIKRLDTGQAVVIAPGSGQRPVITNIHHPSEAHR